MSNIYDSDELMDAYFSEVASKSFGFAVYLDEKGEEVKVTEVIKCGKTPHSRWSDLKLVGKVIRSKCIKMMDVPDNDSSSTEEKAKYLLNYIARATGNINTDPKFKIN